MSITSIFYNVYHRECKTNFKEIHLRLDNSFMFSILFFYDDNIFTQINQDEFSYIKPRDIVEARLVRIEYFDGTYLYS